MSADFNIMPCVKRMLLALLATISLSLATIVLAESGHPPLQKFFSVNGFSLLAELHENTQLLEKIATPILDSGQIHYKGELIGYPGSAVRVSVIDGHWRGILLFAGDLYKIDSIENVMAASSGLNTYQPDLDAEVPMICASPSMHEFESVDSNISSSSISNMGGLNTIDVNPVSSSAITSAATLVDVCANPINGVCLLPEIELAYDLSYQSLPGSETPLQRALREINEMELFFLSGMGFQFSRLSITMLDASQDSLIGADDDPNTLLNRLRILRGTNQLTYLENSRSIFHFVTGRDFPTIPGPSGGNIIGIAYLNQICAGSGLNTGLTDAGDTSLVSLVMAHEIGHNMGAGHDTSAGNGCPENQNVMSPSLGFFASGFDAFSSCSISEINQSVADRLSTSCFDFPIDIGLTADPDNPVSPDKVAAIDYIYTVNVDDGFVPVTSLTITGAIPNPSDGQFVNVSAQGGSCSTSLNSYQCVVTNPAASFQLTVSLSVAEAASEFTMQHSLTTTVNAVSDMIPANNSVNLTLNSFGPSVGTPLPNPNVGSGSSNGGGAVESEPTAAASGSGGGGAINPLALCLLSVGLLFRRDR